jgi:hypothetical protein
MGSALLNKSEQEHSMIFDNRLRRPLILLSTARFGRPDYNVIIPITRIVFWAFVRATLDDKPFASYDFYRYSCRWKAWEQPLKLREGLVIRDEA